MFHPLYDFDTQATCDVLPLCVLGIQTAGYVFPLWVLSSHLHGPVPLLSQQYHAEFLN